MNENAAIVVEQLSLDELYPEAAAEAVDTVAELLLRSTDLLIDELFTDAVASLDGSGDLQAPVWLVISELPQRFKKYYERPVFIKQLILAAGSLTRQFLEGWRGPDCLVEGLLLHILLDGAEGSAELHELELPENWRARLERHLVDPVPYLSLYSDNFDGFEFLPPEDVDFWNMPTFRGLLRPYPGRVVTPYLLDE